MAALHTINELVRWNCKASKSTHRCSCRRNETYLYQHLLV